MRYSQAQYNKAKTYCARIKNAGKKTYALKYLAFKAGKPNGFTPDEQAQAFYDCSYMAAQAVRMHIDHLLTEV